MTARARRDARALLALTLSAFAVTALVAAPADGWRRPTDFPVYSSPSGGEYRVCRDGILFQAGTGRVDDPTSPPAEPTSPVGFTVFSPPPPVDPITGEIDRDSGTIVAEGTIDLPLQTPPVLADQTLWWYFDTHVEQWAGGQLLEPAADAIFFDRQPGSFETDDIEDCFLFRPVTVCRNGQTITVPEYQVQDGDVRGRCPDEQPKLPTTKNQCKKGGWRTYGVFKNQGDCVSFVATKGKNPPAR